MDRDRLRFGLKLAAIALSAVVVTWLGNAPVASRWQLHASPEAPPSAVAGLAPAAAEGLRREIYDGLVAAFATEGRRAWWRLEGRSVVFGFREGGGAGRCTVAVHLPAGGLAPWTLVEGADERWIPWWPCPRATAEARVARVDAARAAAVERVAAGRDLGAAPDP